jgi:hypothetical protein
MRDQATDILFAYWDSLRGQRVAPDRTEIEPRAIAPILGDTFVLETDVVGTLRYRLAGSRICAAFGEEMKGHSFVAPFSQADRNALVRGLADAHAACTGIRMKLTGETMSGRPASFSAVVLPLAHRGRIGQRMIGALVPAEEPFWASRDPVVSLAIAELKLTWPTWQPAETAESPRVTTGRPQLRLIQGGNAA